jgi:hypothetical protein
MNNTVTIDEVVSSAAIALGMENDRYRVLFYEWAFQGARDIGLTTLNLTNTTGSIITSPFNYFAIPSDCVYIDSIAIRVGSDGHVAYPFFDSNYWTNVPDDDQTAYDKDYVVSRQGSNLVFSSTIPNNGYDTVILRYYAMPVDQNNVPLVPEYYLRALVAYIEYMFVKRERYKKRNEIPMSEVQMLYQQWVTLKADAMSKRNQPQKPEIEAAIAMWLTMLPNQKRLMRTPKTPN